MTLKKYKGKRNFQKTPEPRGGKKNGSSVLSFVVQKHAASRLHYDFRLELDGVLLSWAVPKGPSLNPEDKRLAMMVENHPLDYGSFEGTIPKGNYGAGEVIVWDNGVYMSPVRGREGSQRSSASNGMSSKVTDPKKNIEQLRYGLKKGHLEIVLLGKKLKGAFSLVKMHPVKSQTTTGQGRDENAWLLIKHADEYATKENVLRDDSSVLSERRLSDSYSSFDKGGGESSPPAPEGRAGSRRISKIPPPDKKRGTPFKKGRIKKDPMPHHIKPMLATLVREPFDKEGWLFEIKWDGYRAITEIENGTVSLYSRNGNSFVSAYPPVVEALQTLSKHDAVLDGEIVALQHGRPDFHTLQRYGEETAPLQYVLFDLLHLDGEDLRDRPLRERKERLKRLLPEHPSILMYSDHAERNGTAFFTEIRKRGLEGIVAKDGESRYLEGKRGMSWQKIKIQNTQEAVIIGYTEPRATRKHMGALVLGAYKNGKLTYIGHSGGGFTQKELMDLFNELQKIRTTKSPVAEKVPLNSPITWVTPKLVCQISFTEWTPDGRMRHPIYEGLRKDKKPEEVSIETPLSFNRQDELKLTNKDKIFWPKEKYTKGDVISYYERMADTLLPYLKDRPESLNRHPNGIEGKNFFHKDIEMKVPDFVRTEKVWSESTNAFINYLVCDNKETLMYMANLGCIELNPWNSRMQSLDKPDYMIIDLDPGDNTMDELIEVIHVVDDVLTLACEEHYIKTSGKTGFHILVPLGAQYDYDQVRAFSQLLVTMVHKRIPDITSLERSPAKRKNKIYLDYLQNRREQTIAAPYSLRPVEGATVSTPLMWKEVKKGLDPKKFTIETIWKRLDTYGDLWNGMLGRKIDLAESIKCLDKHLNDA